MGGRTTCVFSRLLETKVIVSLSMIYIYIYLHIERERERKISYERNSVRNIFELKFMKQNFRFHILFFYNIHTKEMILSS